MIVVIIAGGSGTRLWPLSTPSYPKHLLSINGDNQTLLQRAYERARMLSDNIYVITEVSHAHHVREQLPEIPETNFVIEPARRNTSGCVLAALHTVQKKGHDADEPMAILWADHYIRDLEGFAHSFRVAGEASANHNRVTLVGIEPTYPSTGFGYIRKDELISDEPYVYSVGEFKEKPDHNLAQEYVNSGNYLWNGGYLVGSVNAFVEAMQNYSPDMLQDFQRLVATENEDAFKEEYLKLDNVAIDYTFSEKVKNLLVVPASFDWLDLGSFKDLYGAVDKDDKENHVHGDKVELEEVQNSFVQNYEDKPVAVIGLDNVVVVNTPNGILVARKDLSQKVGDVSKRFNK
jgi:mannose-1-phosphate guanylyltransferase